MESCGRVEWLLAKMIRKFEFDILKGILIIFVVIGHLLNGDSFFHRVIYWFHMPVFFMITGILSTWGRDNVEFVKKRTLAYVVPYFSWCILLFLLFWIENPLKYMARILYGGAMNTTSYTYQFWFVCALFVSSLVLNATYCKFRNWLYGILVGYLIVWYTFLHQCHIPMLPWSVEVVPFVLVYFIIGICVNRFSDLLNGAWQIIVYFVAIMLAMFMIIGVYYGLLDFRLSMKNLTMHNFLFDMLSPIIFFISLKGICLLLCNVRYLQGVLSYIGQSSLVIMFTHTAIFSLFQYVDVCNPSIKFVLIFILAVVLGCVIYANCKKNRLLSILFLGKR